MTMFSYTVSHLAELIHFVDVDVSFPLICPERQFGQSVIIGELKTIISS